MTQKETILNHLKEYGEVSSNKAWALYGITRLSDIILKLRRDGHDIATVNTTSRNRYGKYVHYANYVYRG